MAASLTSLTGQAKSLLKLKPTHPFPKLGGVVPQLVDFLSTGPGKPMETVSYFQSAAIFFTPATICPAVSVGPEANLRGSLSPLTRILTCVPPTSITKTFMKSLSPATARSRQIELRGTRLTQVRFNHGVFQPARRGTR